MSLNHENIHHGLYTEIFLPDLSVTVRTLGVLGMEPETVPPIELDTPGMELPTEQAVVFMRSMRSWLSEHGRLQRHGVTPKDETPMFDFLSNLHTRVTKVFPENPLSEQAPIRLGNALHVYRKQCPDDVHPKTDRALMALYECYIADALAFKQRGFKDVERMAIKYDPKMYDTLLQVYKGHEYIRPSDIRYAFKNLHPKPGALIRETANTMEYIEQVFVPKLQAETGYRHDIPRQQIRRLTWNTNPVEDAKELFYTSMQKTKPDAQTDIDAERTDLEAELEISKGTAYGLLLEDLIKTLVQDPDHYLGGIATLDRHAVEAVLCDYIPSYKQKLADALEVADLDTYVLREVVPHYFYMQQRHRQAS